MTKTQKRLILIISGVIIIALAIFMLTKPAASVQSGFQTIRMTESAQGYSPNTFTIKKGIPVKFIVTAQEVRSCAGVLLIPKYKIQEFLKAGENTIEFTPTEIGQIPFKCSMGMYTGTFNVVD
jgi:plastocyanin domain-containing protein